MSEAMPTIGKRLCEERACWLLDRMRVKCSGDADRRLGRRSSVYVSLAFLNSREMVHSRQLCAEHSIPGCSRTSAKEGGELQPQSGTQGFQTAMGFYLFLI